MLRARQILKGRISAKNGLSGKLNNAIEYVYPELENLEVTPSGEEQKFKSKKYGFDNVTVHAVESEELNIMPSTENQEYVGMYKKVTVAGDTDLLPENIAEGKEIFGVEGTAKTTNLKITDGYYLCYLGHRQENAQELVDLCGAITSAHHMFYGCQKLTKLDVSKLDTSQCTTMDSMFNDCEKLTKLDLSKWNTSQCTTMDSMFRDCEKLQELDVSNWNTSNVTGMNTMFLNCRNLTLLDVSNFDTNNVIRMSEIFMHCEKLTKLDLSKWNTSQVTYMSSLFYNCKSLQELDVSNFNTSNVTSMYSMFYFCEKLTELDLSSWDLSKVNNCNYMFQYAYDLINLKSFTNLGKGFTQKTTNNSNYTFDIRYCYDLTYESLIDIITNGLYDLNLTYDVANGGVLYTQSCRIGSTHMSKLEATEEGRAALAQAALYGWTVS